MAEADGSMRENGLPGFNGCSSYHVYSQTRMLGEIAKAVTEGMSGWY